VSNAAALPPRRTFGVIRGGNELQRQLSIGPLTVCLCPHDELIRPSNYYFPPLNSVSAFSGTLFPSNSMVYLLKYRDQVGQSASRSVGLSQSTVLIGRTRFGTMSSIPDPTLSLSQRVFLANTSVSSAISVQN
jgi:hypothetical protein